MHFTVLHVDSLDKQLLKKLINTFFHYSCLRQNVAELQDIFSGFLRQINCPKLGWIKEKLKFS